MSPTLEKAMRKESVRQRFLDELITEQVPYCSGVRYDPSGREAMQWFEGCLLSVGFPKEFAKREAQDPRREEKFIAGFPTTPYLIESGIRPVIFVGDDLFTQGYNEAEIRHILIAHEGRHAMQVAMGLPYLDTPWFSKGCLEKAVRQEVSKGIIEIDANYQGWRMLQEFGVREQFALHVTEILNGCIRSLCGFYLDYHSPQEQTFIEQTFTGIGLADFVDKLKSGRIGYTRK